MSAYISQKILVADFTKKVTTNPVIARSIYSTVAMLRAARDDDGQVVTLVF